MPGVRSLVEVFAAARSSAGQERALLKRLDRKYLFHVDRLPALLEALLPHFAVLRAGDVRLATYDSLYFDSPELALFHAHRRGRKVRQKVRMRVYAERRLRVLEVKMKFHGDRTEKARLPLPWGDEEPSAADLAWAATRVLGVERLQPVAWTRFKRLTLVGSTLNERVTVDLGLTLSLGPGAGLPPSGEAGPGEPTSASSSTAAGERAVSLPELAIVEVKQWPPDRRSPTVMALRSAGHRERSFSKYCAAVVALLHERHNRLKPSLRMLRDRRPGPSGSAQGAPA